MRKPPAAAKAIQYFTKYLERKPDDLEVKWLLNLTYMTLGNYPSGVPQKYLLPLSSFDIRREHRTLHRRGSPGRAESVRDGFRRHCRRFRE